MLGDYKSKAIIVDIDGTLSDHKWRQHFIGQVSWDEVHEQSKRDLPHQWCIALILAMRTQGYRVLYVTARNEKYRKDTIEWLSAYVPADYELFMRAPEHDGQEDWVFKLNVYMNQIAPYYNVEFAVDDKASIIEMYRNIGVPSLHCDSNLT